MKEDNLRNLPIPKLYILFSYQLLQIAYTDSYQPNKHILLSSPPSQQQTNNNNNYHKVIKNGEQIKQLFNYFTHLLTKQQQQQKQLIFIIYTRKGYKNVKQIIQKIDDNIKWTYIQQYNVKQQYTNIIPPINNNINNYHQKMYVNYARLYKINDSNNNHLIIYGDTYPTINNPTVTANKTTKQQLLLAISSAYNITNMPNNCIIIQNNQTQILKLKKQLKYKYVIDGASENVNNQIQQAIKIIDIEQANNSNNNNKIQQSNADSQVNKLIKQASILQDICQSYKNSKDQKKHIMETMCYNITTSLNTKYYRLQQQYNARNICALTFKGIVGNVQKMILSAKCNLPKQIGGQLYTLSQQNKVLASAIHNIIQSSSPSTQKLCKCLPMWLMNSHLMRNCSFPNYDKKRGSFIVRPYLKQLNKFTQNNNKLNIQQLTNILQTGKYKNKQIKGLGSLLVMSMLCNQQFIQQGFYDQISYYYNKQQQIYIVCKIDFNNIFTTNSNNNRNNNNNNQYNQIIFLTSSPQLSSIKQTPNNLSNNNNQYTFKQLLEILCNKYLRQIEQIYLIIVNNYPFIQAAFKYHNWLNNKQSELKVFKNRVISLSKIISLINNNNADSNNNVQQMQQTQQLQSKITKISNLQTIDSRWLIYLVTHNNNTFQHFTRPEQTNLFFSSLSKYQQDQTTCNQYITKIKQSQNFIIHTNSNIMPVFSLLAWIKQYLNTTTNNNNNSNLQVQYISLLKSKQSRYENRLKQSKLSHKNTIFIIDHCQLDHHQQTNTPPISTIISNFKTIYIYRLQKVDTTLVKLKALNDTMNYHHKKLLESQDQIFRVIFYNLNHNNENMSVYQKYKLGIFLWIRNKCSIYQLQYGKSLELLAKLVSDISVNKNRLLQYTQNKKNTSNNNMLLLYSLPIYIQKQRVYLAHDICQYLQAHYLYKEIIDDKWCGILHGQQLQYFKMYYGYLSKNMQVTIRDKIRKLIYQECCKKNNSNIYGGWGNSDGHFRFGLSPTTTCASRNNYQLQQQQQHKNNQKYIDAIQLLRATGINYQLTKLTNINYKILSTILSPSSSLSTNNNILYCLTNNNRVVKIYNNDSNNNNNNNNNQISIINNNNNQQTTVINNKQQQLSLVTQQYIIKQNQLQQNQQIKINTPLVVVEQTAKLKMKQQQQNNSNNNTINNKYLTMLFLQHHKQKVPNQNKAIILEYHRLYINQKINQKWKIIICLQQQQKQKQQHKQSFNSHYNSQICKHGQINNIQQILLQKSSDNNNNNKDRTIMMVIVVTKKTIYAILINKDMITRDDNNHIITYNVKKQQVITLYNIKQQQQQQQQQYDLTTTSIITTNNNNNNSNSIIIGFLNINRNIIKLLTYQIVNLLSINNNLQNINNKYSRSIQIINKSSNKLTCWNINNQKQQQQSSSILISACQQASDHVNIWTLNLQSIFNNSNNNNNIVIDKYQITTSQQLSSAFQIKFQQVYRVQDNPISTHIMLNKNNQKIIYVISMHGHAKVITLPAMYYN